MKSVPPVSLLAAGAIAFAPACTISVREQGSATTLLPDQVAQTLTAAPTLPPTRTPPASATPFASATPAPTSTGLPTATATQGPTPTPTAPPLPPDDPRQGINLAAPDERDDFSTRYGWFEYDDSRAASITWQPGQLKATDHRDDGFLWWSTSGHTAWNLYAEVRATAGECEGKDSYGMAIRIGGSGYDRGYTLEFSCDGHYRMRRFDSGSLPEVLQEWTPSEMIHTGSGAENQIGFLAEGPSLTGFANGQTLATVEDAFYVFGNLGLFAEANESEGATAVFRDFALWYLPR